MGKAKSNELNINIFSACSCNTQPGTFGAYEVLSFEEPGLQYNSKHTYTFT